MSHQAKTILTYSTLILVSLFFLFSGLVYAKSFLAPLSVAILLAMVMLPVCRWFERKGISRGWASLFSDFIILLFCLLLSGILAAQVKKFSEDWPNIKQRIEPKIEQLQQFIADKTGISVAQQNQQISQQLPGSASSEQQQEGASQPQEQPSQQQQPQENAQPQPPVASPSESTQGGATTPSSSGGSVLTKAGTFIGHFFSTLGDILLIFIYIFFFLRYRKKFRKSILKMVPQDKRDLAQDIIGKSAKVSQNYLSGRLLLIIFLAILYAIGLTISGVQQAILISILAAVLSLIPYIGNIIGFVLASGLALFSDSGATGILGVAITFSITQFVESYILEPFVVGDKVDLNPVFTIIVVVLGGAVWGVVGMLIAIPALGIVKVVFDHIPVLRPLGYLFGEEDTEDKKEGKDNLFKKTKRWALHKFQAS